VIRYQKRRPGTKIGLSLEMSALFSLAPALVNRRQESIPESSRDGSPLFEPR
jgi:hypothetical protein